MGGPQGGLTPYDTLYIGSCVRAPVLSNLLNSFGQSYKMVDKASLHIGLPQRVKPIQ